jgi:hypothetical protein
MPKPVIYIILGSKEAFQDHPHLVDGALLTDNALENTARELWQALTSRFGFESTDVNTSTITFLFKTNTIEGIIEHTLNWDELIKQYGNKNQTSDTKKSDAYSVVGFEFHLYDITLAELRNFLFNNDQTKVQKMADLKLLKTKVIALELDHPETIHEIPGPYAIQHDFDEEEKRVRLAAMPEKVEIPKFRPDQQSIHDYLNNLKQNLGTPKIVESADTRAVIAKNIVEGINSESILYIQKAQIHSAYHDEVMNKHRDLNFIREPINNAYLFFYRNFSQKLHPWNLIETQSQKKLRLAIEKIENEEDEMPLNDDSLYPY